MIRKVLIAIIYVIVFALVGMIAKSQEIEADVVVNVEQLQFEARTNVSTMERDIERYINNQEFTDLDWEGPKIPVNITIYLSGGSNNEYSAKMYLQSMRYLDGPEPVKTVNVKFFDDKWSFEYARGANLTYNQLRFDPFTSVIDYYMLLVIGFDLDTYGELDGSPFFSAARRIVELGASRNAQGFSRHSAPGEFTRFNLTSELTDARFNEFRKLVFAFFVDGLDMLAFDSEKALTNLKDIFYYMAQFKKNKLVESSVLMQLFFDSQAQKIATIFNGHEDEEVFQTLKYMDPSNSTLYDQAKAGEFTRRKK